MTSNSGTSLGMDDLELDAFLSEQSTGTLSFSSDDEPYAIPISFGFLDGVAYVQLTHGENSRKRRHLESNSRVCLTTYATSSVDDWASAVLRGRLEAVPEAERERATLALSANAEFPGLEPFQEGFEEL
jgi:hypothetical protein